MNKEEIQKEFMTLEMYNEQIKKLQEEMGKIEVMKLELLKSIESMEGLKTSKELLIPLGAGAFLKAETPDNEKVIVGVGADNFIEKNVDEVIEEFRKSVEDLEKAESMIKQQIEKTAAEVNRLQKDLEKKLNAIEQQEQMQQMPTAQ